MESREAPPPTGSRLAAPELAPLEPIELLGRTHRTPQFLQGIPGPRILPVVHAFAASAPRDGQGRFAFPTGLAWLVGSLAAAEPAPRFGRCCGRLDWL